MSVPEKYTTELWESQGEFRIQKSEFRMCEYKQNRVGEIVSCISMYMSRILHRSFCILHSAFTCILPLL